MGNYLSVGSYLLMHDCSGRNITWQYIHNNGTIPAPYDTCADIEAILKANKCKKGRCHPFVVTDKEFERYEWYDWDGLGDPLDWGQEKKVKVDGKWMKKWKAVLKWFKGLGMKGKKGKGDETEGEEIVELEEAAEQEETEDVPSANTVDGGENNTRKRNELSLSKPLPSQALSKTGNHDDDDNTTSNNSLNPDHLQIQKREDGNPHREEEEEPSSRGRVTEAAEEEEMKKYLAPYPLNHTSTALNTTTTTYPTISPVSNATTRPLLCKNSTSTTKPLIGGGGQECAATATTPPIYVSGKQRIQLVACIAVVLFVVVVGTAAWNGMLMEFLRYGTCSDDEEVVEEERRERRRVRMERKRMMMTKSEGAWDEKRAEEGLAGEEC